MQIKLTSFNPLVTNPYHLDESNYFLGASGVILFFIFISFYEESNKSKQNSSRWDAPFRGDTSGAILFAYVP